MLMIIAIMGLLASGECQYDPPRAPVPVYGPPATPPPFTPLIPPPVNEVPSLFPPQPAPAPGSSSGTNSEPFSLIESLPGIQFASPITQEAQLSFYAPPQTHVHTQANPALFLAPPSPSQVQVGIPSSVYAGPKFYSSNYIVL
ncbi:hypothetical protein C0J52_13624 [Blattella germanica]|nr:hypothetical protein C0J52_13624 [Blattella germanica]